VKGELALQGDDRKDEKNEVKSNGDKKTIQTDETNTEKYWTPLEHEPIKNAPGPCNGDTPKTISLITSVHLEIKMQRRYQDRVKRKKRLQDIPKNPTNRIH